MQQPQRLIYATAVVRESIHPSNIIIYHNKVLSQTQSNNTITCCCMWQLEVFILKLLAVDGFATSAIVVCEVTPLTHLMAAVKALRKYGGTLHITQQVKYTLLSFTHTLSQTHMYWYLHTFSLKHTYTQIHAHPPTHTHSLSLSLKPINPYIYACDTRTLSLKLVFGN